MPGFADMNMVAVGPDGRADPQTQLFRSSALGVETGPFVSQVRCAIQFAVCLRSCLGSAASEIWHSLDLVYYRLFVPVRGYIVLDVNDGSRKPREFQDFATQILAWN